MSRNTFVIGDIHGGYKALLQVLERAHVTENDKLIFLGDYVDGWSESSKVITALIQLNQQNECIFMRGNHEDLFLQWLETDKINQRWLINGGNSTVASYAKLSKEQKEEHHSFIKKLRPFYLDDQNRLFLHAGFTHQRRPLEEYYPYVYYWDRTLWETALATDPGLSPTDKRFPERFKHFKQIFIGHTPVTRIGETHPYQALNVWNVDTGAGFKGRLSIMNIATEEVSQSDAVYKLYPNEKGRN